MRARTRERPCPHGREQPLSTNTKGVRGLRPRTFRAKAPSLIAARKRSFRAGVDLACGLHRFDLRHLGDGDIPPAVVARASLVAADLDRRPMELKPWWSARTIVSCRPS